MAGQLLGRPENAVAEVNVDVSMYGTALHADAYTEPTVLRTLG
jgi:hypothetical protein